MENLSKVKSQSVANSYEFQHFVLLFICLFFLFGSHAYGTIWTGLADPDDSWSNGGNWLGGLSPISTDSVIFNAGDSWNINIVDTDFTIAGLQYIGNGTHTTDFAGASHLQIDSPLYVGYGGSADGATVTWTNGGTVTIGDPLNLQTFYIGVNTSSGTVSNTGFLLVDGPVVDAYVNTLMIGAKTNAGSKGTADGSLILGSNSSLHVGTVATPGIVTVGYNVASWVQGGAGSGTGLLDVTQGSVELHLSELNVGYQGR